ncbi:Restriction endonuclease [compost metagenome]
MYFEVKIAGEVFRAAIECKNYSKEVSIGKIRDFHSVLTDIGDIKGIFLTKKGYQSGAIKYAEKYGISLKELRQPTDKDWEGRIKSIVINTTVYSIDLKQPQILLNKEWAEENKTIGSNANPTFEGYTDNLTLFDSNNQVITNFTELINKLPRYMELKNNLKHEFNFEDAFMIINGSRQKVDKIIFSYDMISDSIVTESEFFAEAILKDVKSQGIKFFDGFGGVK